MINPGSRPVENATLAAAETNLQAFLDEATERGLRLADEPERDAGADVDGRYGWVLPLVGGDRVPVLMPGSDLAELRGLSAQSYCVRVRSDWWWWADAAGMVIPLHPGRPAN
jgi:hypothetical protein